MKKNYLLILLPLVFITSCKWNMIDPDVEIPSVNLTLSEVSPTREIIISWNKCDDAQGYGITRTFTRDGITEESIYNYISADTTSYIDSKCEPGTEYTYTVTAGYFKGKGLYFGRIFGDSLEKTSEAKTITTKSDVNISLEYPKNVNITQDSEHSNALSLSWTPCDNASAYEIYQARVHGDYVEEYEKVQTVETNEGSVLHLYNENTYRFKIKALGSDGQSSLFSAWKSGIVPVATNTSMDKAVYMENGVTERFYTNQDSLWFKITPVKGKLTVNTIYKLSFMIFSADGSQILKNDFDFTEQALWNTASFSDCINPGESYLLRVKSNECIQIIVE